MASWARRSLAAETIFMALVICCVFLTLRIRRRMWRRAGIACGAASGGLVAGPEDSAEFREDGLQALGELSLDVLLLGDGGEDAGVARLQEGVELLLVAPAVGDGDLVEVAVRGREDDHDLLLHRKRLVLPLLQDLGHALPAGQGGEADRDKIGRAHV